MAGGGGRHIVIDFNGGKPEKGRPTVVGLHKGGRREAGLGGRAREKG